MTARQQARHLRRRRSAPRRNAPTESLGGVPAHAYSPHMTTGYHWSPATRRESIQRRGLLIGAEPCVNGVEDDHRNEWISLSPTPAQAWWLSGQALECGGFTAEHPVWDLWQVDLTDADTAPCAGSYPEMRVHHSLTPDRLTWIASRQFATSTT